MKGNFLRLREVLLSEFPGQWKSIHGDNYPVPEWTSYAAGVISAVQLFAMVLVMVGESLWTYVPGFRRPPEFYYKMKDNPAMTFIIVFLVIPSYVQSFANTGAFEIYVDEKLVSPHNHRTITGRCFCQHIFSLLIIYLVNSMPLNITVNYKKIFSKLETGRMPNVAEVIRVLESLGLKRGA